MSPYICAVAGGLSLRLKALLAKAVRAAFLCLWCPAMIVVAILGFFWSALPGMLMIAPLAEGLSWLQGADRPHAGSHWAYAALLGALGYALAIRASVKAVSSPGLAGMYGPASPGGDPWMRRALQFMMAPFAKFLNQGGLNAVVAPDPGPMFASPVRRFEAGKGWLAAVAEGLSADWESTAGRFKWVWLSGGVMGAPLTGMCAILVTPVILLLPALAAQDALAGLWVKFKASSAGASVARKWLDGLAADGSDRFAAKEAGLIADAADPSASQSPPPRL